MISFKTMKFSKSKILFFSSILFFFLAGIFSFPVFSQDDQEPSPTPDPAIQEKIEDRIQNVLTAQTEKKYAFGGEITKISQDTIEIETKDDFLTLVINDETEIVNEDREPLVPADLEKGDYVIAMGYLDEEENLDTRRLVLSEPPEPLGQKVVFGKVSDLTSDGEKILTLKELKEEDIYEIEVTTRTNLSQQVDNETESITFDEISTDSLLAAVGNPDDDNPNFLTATTIRVFLEQAIEKEETASPSPEASPAAEE